MLSEGNETRSAAAPAKHRIVHIHIPKTAGTAIRNSVEARAGAEWRPAPHVTERNVDELLGGNYNFFSGHIGYVTAKRIGGEFVTVMRDPVDRFVSTYYFWRQLYETGLERTPKTLMAWKYPLEDFLTIKDEIQLTEEFFNRATWQLAIGSSVQQRRDCRSEFVSDDALLARAIEHVADFAVVGVQERLDGFIRQMKARFGLDLAVEHVNVTEKRPSVRDIPVKTVRQIYEWAYLDFELYRVVCNMVK